MSHHKPNNKNKRASGPGGQKTDGYAMFDAFLNGTIGEDQYKTLTKRAARANTTEVDDALKETLRVSTRRASVLSGGDGIINAALLIDSIDEELLFTQIAARVEGGQNQQRTPVKLNLFGAPIESQGHTRTSKRTFIPHNFDRHSVYWTRLFQWNMFNEVTQLIIRSVDNLIGEYTDKDISAHNNNNNSNRMVKPTTTITVSEGPVQNMDTYGLQHRMAQSYHGARSLSCMDFTETAADILGASLLKLLVMGTRLVFIFQWTNNASFMFFVTFDCLAQGAKPWHNTEYDGSYCIALHYTDLTTDYSLPDDHDDEAQDMFLPFVPRKKKMNEKKQKKTLPRRRQAKKPRKATSYSSSNRSSLFQSGLRDGASSEDEEEEEEEEEYDDDDDDDDDDEYERRDALDYKRNAKSQGKEDATDYIITHYGRRVNRFFISKLKGAYIAYRTYGYIKNDNTTF